MAIRAPLVGEYALLGLLRLRPAHGYEMARFFEREGLSEVCPVEQNLLYAYLRNLEERGLVRWQEVRVGLHPPRKTYELTPDGVDLVDAWMRRPVERMRDIRVDFLVKLFFLHRLDRSAEGELLRRQIAVCETYRGALVERQARTEGFGRLVAGSKLSAAEATLRWLSDYETSLAGQPVASEAG